MDSISSGMPEAVADLDQLAAADHDLLAGSQGHGGQQQGGGVVVDDVHAARGGYRAGQCGQRTSTAAGAATGLQVELDVCGAAAVTTASTAACDSGARPRFVCTTTPVALMTGRRLDALTRQCGDGVLGDLLRLDLPRSRPLLGLGDNGFHQRAAEYALGLGEARVGEQHIGAGHAPSGIAHVRSREHGGGGRESNPPATGTAAQRF